MKKNNGFKLLTFLIFIIILIVFIINLSGLIINIINNKDIFKHSIYCFISIGFIGIFFFLKLIHDKII